MILVELETGSQRLFGSQEELAAAIHRGELGAASRIYHRASGQWLPITVHPEFRRVAARLPELPLPPLARKHWTFFTVEQRPDGESPGAEPEGGRTAGATTLQTVAKETPPGRWRRALRYIRSIGKR
jgi:hypothetical protein